MTGHHDSQDDLAEPCMSYLFFDRFSETLGTSVKDTLAPIMNLPAKI